MKLVMLLLATIALAMPLRAAVGSSGSACNDAHPAPRVVASPDHPADACCCDSDEAPTDTAIGTNTEPAQAPLDRGPCNGPCDDCGCPMRCCATAAPIVLGCASASPLAFTPSVRMLHAIAEQSEPSPPNLLGLKRPPRLSAAT